jgi:hypothetical protein
LVCILSLFVVTVGEKRLFLTSTLVPPGLVFPIRRLKAVFRVVVFRVLFPTQCRFSVLQHVERRSIMYVVISRNIDHKYPFVTVHLPWSPLPGRSLLSFVPLSRLNFSDLSMTFIASATASLPTRQLRSTTPFSPSIFSARAHRCRHNCSFLLMYGPSYPAPPPPFNPRVDPVFVRLSLSQGTEEGCDVCDDVT